jgi:galactose-1-phosphate uridylyltransferase
MLAFKQERFHSRIVLPTGEVSDRVIEVRTHPITGRTCRITYSRGAEREPGAETLPAPPPFAADRRSCPFCRAQLARQTPRLEPALAPEGRLVRGKSTLFPNLFPYGRYSAVSLFDDTHFVEIGTALPASYTDSFLNCRDYLLRVLTHDPAAVWMAVTQNHLPSAGGSLLHPHLQVQADRLPSNFQRFLQDRAEQHFRRNGTRLFADYLEMETQRGERRLGATGRWEWLAAFAPEGFFEIWGILPGVTSLSRVSEEDWGDLAQGVLNTQRFYRSLGRNGYNLGILFLEDGSEVLEPRVVLTVRSNHAPWVRSDFTGFEVMLGDMATFTAPEETAARARPFWEDRGGARLGAGVRWCPVPKESGKIPSRLPSIPSVGRGRGTGHLLPGHAGGVRVPEPRCAEAASREGRPQSSLAPRGTGLSGTQRATAPSASWKPVTRHSDIRGPICLGGKLTTATTSLPMSSSGR